MYTDRHLFPADTHMSGLPAQHQPTQASSHLTTVTYCPFVRFTVTGLARNLHPIPSMRKALVFITQHMRYSVVCIIQYPSPKCNRILQKKKYDASHLPRRTTSNERSGNESYSISAATPRSNSSSTSLPGALLRREATIAATRPTMQPGMIS